jgi:hypothetical protein
MRIYLAVLQAGTYNEQNCPAFVLPFISAEFMAGVSLVCQLNQTGQNSAHYKNIAESGK